MLRSFENFASVQPLLVCGTSVKVFQQDNRRRRQFSKPYSLGRIMWYFFEKQNKEVLEFKKFQYHAYARARKITKQHKRKINLKVSQWKNWGCTDEMTQKSYVVVMIKAERSSHDRNPRLICALVFQRKFTSFAAWIFQNRSTLQSKVLLSSTISHEIRKSFIETYVFSEDIGNTNHLLYEQPCWKVIDFLCCSPILDEKSFGKFFIPSPEIRIHFWTVDRKGHYHLFGADKISTFS